MKFDINNDKLKRLLVRPNKRTFTFYPAILCVSQQVHNEGYEILYRQNTATATINLDPEDEYSTVECLDNLIPPDNLGAAIACRFTKWEVTVKLNINVPKDATNIIFDFVSGILRAIPNMNKLKVQLNLWDYPERRELITFANPYDFDDIAEQIFRPFSTIRVRQAEFVDKSGYPIRSALSLSRLMMSDTAPPAITLHELFNDLSLFLDDSLSKQSRRVVNARLVPLEVACDQYDVDTFRSTLRSLLAYFSYFRGLVAPQHLVKFAQDSASAETGNGRIPDCPKDVFGQWAKLAGD
ncbi:hypothetical protein OEA41_004431 [Lepraria neglecta]|uniref:Uncharacterized protein n=1 Tax=Lepraria neglecta TaxID=209136 RepID=A0AAD9YYK6_9LECA|nr:hypothetical protein OEA41_004431 [Lepraria neglecta]